jgi:hypothetical protein
MTFVETLYSNWEIIIFIGGGLINLGYTFSSINSNKLRHDEEILLMKTSISTLEKKIEVTQSDFSEIRGDIKSINAKLDLLINNKIR